jgi:hypothetical protein
MKKIFALTAMSSALLLAACGGGDINLSPTNIDNSQDNSTNTGGGGSSNPCASYTDENSTLQQGQQLGNDCFYAATFVSDENAITAPSVSFSRIAGAHIFEDSLYIGEDVDKAAAESGVRIPQEGEGTKLKISAGVTMVFEGRDSYVRIARGSQIFAEGSADAPIIFTADEDYKGILTDANRESQRGLWGGLQINGNGLTNKCDDGSVTGKGGGSGINEMAATANNVHNCHVLAEGRPSYYGGNNNAESSGVLKYVVVKHAGYTVASAPGADSGDDLNAITLNAVGSGTVVSYVQAYTSFDDGFEMFGGAVNLDHVVAVNVGDDALDFSAGYVGNIQYAVVLDTSGANNCVEADNTGEGKPDGTTPLTKSVISNLTCITSSIDKGKGTNSSEKGDSEGLLFREGTFFELYNSITTSNDPQMASNECFEIHDTEGPETINGMQNGDSKASSNIVACSEALKMGKVDAANTGFDLAVWLNGGDGSAEVPTNTNKNNVVLTGVNSIPAKLIVGGVGTRGYLTAAELKDVNDVVIFDQATQLTDVSDVTAVPGIDNAFFKKPSYIGGANEGDNWLAGWTVGLSAPLAP